MLEAALFVSVATWIALLSRVIREPANHVAVDPLLAIIPFIFLVALAWLPRYRQRRVMRGGVTAFALVSSLLVLAMDRANVLVQYDRWAQRGMPGKPCNAIARQVWACTPQAGR